MFKPLILLTMALATGLHTTLQAAEEKSPTELGAVKFRSLGPWISGRVTRVSGVVGDPLTYYAAFSQGGVWKSSDAGQNWSPIFDEQSTNSIGAIAVAPSDANVIYVGAGEANIRGNVTIGNGVFKSTDAGKTWTHVLKLRGQIGTIDVDPRNPDIAFAAVLGSPFGEGEQRGVYRTLDGGKNWKKVLYKDAKTGASDVAIHPNNPRIVFAGLWQTKRQPWVSTSGGAGSGLHLSVDGGDTWKALQGEGLPSGVWGRVGVRVAPSNPDVVYALIEAKNGGLFRSQNGGKSWSQMSDHAALRQRAWYYTVLTIDPQDENTVWFPQVPMLKTIDGGKTITSVDTKLHGDFHDVWIDPTNNKRLISGDDGGIGISVNGGNSWFSPPTPTPQFYNIDVDDRFPYHVGGTMQDWGTASGPAFTLREGGLTTGDFYFVGGGEAGDFVYDKTQAGHIYAGEYSGYVSHYQEGTGNFRNISIYPRNFSGTAAKDSKYRFQWTAPFVASVHEKGVIYHGANVVFRSEDRGQNWAAISPDLTRDDKTKQQWSGGPITGDITGVEVYNTIFSMAESPRQKNEMWVGSDDGLVHLTRDGGKTWKNITPSKMPEWGTVEGIEVSRHQDGVAYVVVDARRLDDNKPYLFVTRNYGESWQLLNNGLPADQHLFVLREDPVDAQLLFVGAERGLFFSRNGGQQFADMRNNLPPVGVADIEIKHNDLILGTRRGIWVLDDLSAFRQLTTQVKQRDIHLFDASPAYRIQTDFRWDGDSSNAAENRPMSAIIHYWLKKAPIEPAEGVQRKETDADELLMEIRDEKGELIRRLSSIAKPNQYAPDDADAPEKPNEPALTKKAGLNRVFWDLRHEGAKRLDNAKIDAGNPERGPMALPGRYQLTLHYQGKTYSSSIEVKSDPRSPVNADDLIANHRFALAVRDALNTVQQHIETVRAIKAQAMELKSRVQNKDGIKVLADTAERLIKRCEVIENRLHNPEAKVSYDVLRGHAGGAKLYSQLAPLYSDVQRSDYPPTQGQREQLLENLADLNAIDAELTAMKKTELSALEAQVKAANLPRVILP